ncbi:uncharacterized protein [Miscanthus floridulus]|uniref:uncharacterized protein isoform X2 n=1 Tax=Miscanthus floridulus TaxID=154761 RepID=UPI00345B3CE3
MGDGDGDYALHPQPGAADVAVWPGELDEQLITELLSDDSFLLGELQQVPAGDEQHCSRDTGASSAPAAPCISGGGTAAEHQELLPQPEAVSRALCSVYTGPTIRDIEKALSTSRPYPWSSPTVHLLGAASRAPEKYTTKVRSCGGKTPGDGYKWRKYGQKSIRNHPHPRSYYKCTSFRCGAKKHVEKSTDDPEMLIVTYEGPHLHGPQPLFPRRQWLSIDLSGAGAAAASKTKQQQQQARASSSPAASAALASGEDGGGGWPPSQKTMTRGRDVDARGGPTAAAGETATPQIGRAGDAVSTQPRLVLTADSCDDGSTASVPPPRAAASFPHCDSPPTTTWSCPDFPFAWSPEAPLLL